MGTLKKIFTASSAIAGWDTVKKHLSEDEVTVHEKDLLAKYWLCLVYPFTKGTKRTILGRKTMAESLWVTARLIALNDIVDYDNNTTFYDSTRTWNQPELRLRLFDLAVSLKRDDCDDSDDMEFFRTHIFTRILLILTGPFQFIIRILLRDRTETEKKFTKYLGEKEQK